MGGVSVAAMKNIEIRYGAMQKSTRASSGDVGCALPGSRPGEEDHLTARGFNAAAIRTVSRWHPLSVIVK